MTSTAPAPTHTPESQRRALNVVLAVGLADALLLVALLGLTAAGAQAKRWAWWFPALVLVTAGPLGSIIGDAALRRQLPPRG
jgi:hypothetical protein